MTAHETEITHRLVDLVGDGRRTLVVAPWREDGHPDHEATGRAAAAAALRTGAELLEYPIWFWHRAHPEDAPWHDLVIVRLQPGDIARKQQAIAAHRTQVAPLSPSPGDETLLSADFLAHFTGEPEIFVRRPPVDDALDKVHVDRHEPGAVDGRWYEQRKRDLTLTVLPRRRFRNALEVGCSTGALAAALAERCDVLTAVDSSPTALARANARLHDLDGVTTMLAVVPDTWPRGSYDLIVLSEVAYFLSPAALDHLAERVTMSVSLNGVVLLCHWRHDVEGWVLDGPEAHRRLVARIGLPVSARYTDRDVESLVLCAPDQLPDAAT